MSDKQHWPRWILASVSQHFNDAKGSDLPLFIEGQDREQEDEVDILELRINISDMIEQSKDDWKIIVEINILIKHIMDDTDFHKIWKNIGIVVDGFTDIMIYKYGDNDAFLGCLQLDGIMTQYYGQIDLAVKLEQATVEGHYYMILRS